MLWSGKRSRRRPNSTARAEASRMCVGLPHEFETGGGMSARGPENKAIAYVAARLPTLSETFVYRELMGLRSRGRTIVPVTIRKPAGPFADPALNRLAG